MNSKVILIVSGEPNSIFLEIFFKSLKFKKYKCPIILISSIKLVKNYIHKFKIKKKINLINYNEFDKIKINNKSLNLININLKSSKNIKHSNTFIKKSFDIALSLIKKNNLKKLINGPIIKKKFLKSKYLGVTEYLSEKINTKKYAMLIYNKNLSVCPLTTHVPLKHVPNYITKKNIYEKIKLINSFYKQKRGFKPKIGIVGLNPHCESVDRFNEDEKIIKPAIKHLLKLGFKVSGPFAADTIFLKKNRNKFDVILGMYHDQVLTPIKTLFEYDAINITLGLPFLRVSPDHGPNEKMIDKNISNPLSLIRAIEFLDRN
tara:strand:+ start:330 stop:1283 length:954 start_codon:yes stop_codon:yes gene_type:complete